jgi:8-oxo-dGTP diphosphatase
MWSTVVDRTAKWMPSVACDRPEGRIMSEGLPRVGSALIVRDEANRILLGKRNKDPQRGSWVLPGGKIHAFESIADAAARELAEETGLTVEVQSQFRVYEIINAPHEHRIVIYSLAKAVGGDLRASDDISEVRWVSLHELSDFPLTPLVRKVLADAGYIGEKAPPTADAEEVVMLFPISVAEAERRPPARCKPPARPRRRRATPVYRESLMLFESCLAE